MQLVEQSLLLVLVLWVLGHVGSQRGPKVILFWWDVMGMSWMWLGGGSVSGAEAKGGPSCRLRLSILRDSETLFSKRNS